MDNASKALIMAGAILIAVAIVGIGIYIFSTANALTDDAVGQIDALAVSAVNAKLENYEGDNVRGSEVRQMMKDINTLNLNKSLPTEITITAGGIIKKVGNLYEADTNLKDNGRYKVVPTYNESNGGYIQTMTVTKN